MKQCWSRCLLVLVVAFGATGVFGCKARKESDAALQAGPANGQGAGPPARFRIRCAKNTNATGSSEFGVTLEGEVAGRGPVKMAGVPDGEVFGYEGSLQVHIGGGSGRPALVEGAVPFAGTFTMRDFSGWPRGPKMHLEPQRVGGVIGPIRQLGIYGQQGELSTLEYQVDRRVVYEPMFCRVQA